MAHKYRGSISLTATGERCSKWSTFIEWLAVRMKRSQTNMEKLKRKRGIFSFSQDDPIDLAIVTGANKTQRGMEEQGKMSQITIDSNRGFFIS